MEDPIRINVSKNVIHDNVLDLYGNSFSFDHVKGLSEWLKNSVDAYKRAKVADRDQYLFLRFNDGKGTKNGTIECIDFNGMSEEDITKAVKIWFDPQASKRGNTAAKVFGGHGNGGKFYMRQMFKQSHFITYKNGHLNIFGFNENKEYGFSDGYQNKTITPSEALKFGGLNESYFPRELIQQVLDGKTGFTIVRGIGPLNMVNMVRWRFIVDQLISHPQSKRILERIPAKVVSNGQLVMSEVKGQNPDPYPGFEDLEPILIPETLIYETDSERTEVTLSNEEYPQGALKLYTSSTPLQRNTKSGELNRIDILGEIGVIGSYKINELGGVAFRLPQSVFVYGEVDCSILESPEHDAVQNDRAKLVENHETKALLEWIDAQVVELCHKISEKEQKERAEKMKDISSFLNGYLNQWKDKFMSKILADVLSGDGPGTGTGGTGGSGTNTGTGTGGPKPPLPGPDSGGDEGGGDQPKKIKRSPKVLLSSLDADPFPPFDIVHLDSRQPAVYQRFQDVDEGVYWINTSAPLAEKILKEFGQDSSRFRDYLFQRYVDVFIKEALAKLEKDDPAEFKANTVEDTISDVILKVHQAAAEDLSAFLFDDTFKSE